ncbi:MAG: polysaccharide deacetylase family protein [Oribacterium sp.]|nr:polysaccharide deacetylase family protein [Oribacterium sp.]
MDKDQLHRQARQNYRQRTNGGAGRTGRNPSQNKNHKNSSRSMSGGSIHNTSANSGRLWTGSWQDSGSGSAGRKAAAGAATSGAHRTTTSRRPAPTRSHSTVRSTSGGRRRVQSKQEIEARRREQRRRALRKKRRQQAWMYRFTALFFFAAVILLGVKGIRAMNHALEHAREEQRGVLETVTPTSGYDAADPVTPETTTAASAEQNVDGLDMSDPTHVLSGGRYVDTTKPMVALTWDDGPDSKVGNRLMDYLEAVDGRGTFFMVGNRVSENQDEVKRMVQDGHEVANHSWDHDLKLSKKGTDYIANEFNKTNDIIEQVSGVKPTLIRLPGGIISDDVRNTVTQPMIYWSLDTEDWKTRDAQSTINAIESNIKDGDIVLMHEIYEATGDACQTVIPWLQSQGYQMVTVSELIKFRGATVDASSGKQYESFRPKPTEAASSTEAQESSATQDSAAVPESSAAQSDDTSEANANAAESESQSSTNAISSTGEDMASETSVNVLAKHRFPGFLRF